MSLCYKQNRVFRFMRIDFQFTAVSFRHCVLCALQNALTVTGKIPRSSMIIYTTWQVIFQYFRNFMIYTVVFQIRVQTIAPRFWQYICLSAGTNTLTGLFDSICQKKKNWQKRKGVFLLQDRCIFLFWFTVFYMKERKVQRSDKKILG